MATALLVPLLSCIAALSVQGASSAARRPHIVVAADPRAGPFTPALVLAAAASADGIRTSIASAEERRLDVLSAAHPVEFISLGSFVREWHPIPGSEWKHLAFAEERTAGFGQHPPLYWSGLKAHFVRTREIPDLFVCDFTTFGCKDMARAMQVPYVITAPCLVNMADPKVPPTGGRQGDKPVERWMGPALTMIRGLRWMTGLRGSLARLAQAPRPEENLRIRETVEVMHPGRDPR